MMKFCTDATAIAGLCLFFLTLPSQLHGLPGHLQSQNGETADNVEMENALVQALLALAQRPPWQQQAQSYETGQLMTAIQNLVDNQQRPQHTSESQSAYEAGKMMSAIQNLLVDNQQFPQRKSQALGQSRRHPLAGTELEATTQQSGITIEYCGAVGNIIESSLKFGLGFIPGGDQAYGVYVACADPTYTCTTVTVAVPANQIKADVDICNPSGGSPCVSVYAGNCKAGFLAFPLLIDVPINNGQSIRVTIKVDIFSKCAEVQVDAPQCPPGVTPYDP